MTVSAKYIAVCPAEPVNNQCPVELVIVENTLPQPLTWEQFQNELAPVIIPALLMCWGWKRLRKLVWN